MQISHAISPRAEATIWKEWKERVSDPLADLGKPPGEAGTNCNPPGNSHSGSSFFPQGHWCWRAPFWSSPSSLAEPGAYLPTSKPTPVPETIGQEARQTGTQPHPPVGHTPSIWGTQPAEPGRGTANEQAGATVCGEPGSQPGQGPAPTPGAPTLAACHNRRSHAAPRGGARDTATVTKGSALRGPTAWLLHKATSPRSGKTQPI